MPWDFAEWYNVLEAVFWTLMSVLVLATQSGRPRTLRRLATLTALSLFAFAMSDLVELSTGVWWRPWWLLLWKVGCGIAISWGGWQLWRFHRVPADRRTGTV